LLWLTWNKNNPRPTLTNLNLNNFKIMEAMGLKLLLRCPLEGHYLRTKFNENLPRGSEEFSREHTDRQTDRQTDW
jgi:hypothetical protein